MNLIEIFSKRIDFLYTTKNVTIIPAGYSGGQPKGGVDKGPEALLNNGLQEQINSLGYSTTIRNLKSLKNLTLDFKKHCNLKNLLQTSVVTREIHDLAMESALKKDFVLTIGGDHSIAIGTISGTSAVYDDLGVVWVDAHADINTPSSTTSGNIHGCPVSFLTGLSGPVDHFQEWLHTTSIHKSRIVYIDLDAAEKDILRDSGIKAFSMHEVDRWGINTVVEASLSYLDNSGKKCPIHLSFDVDALDPSVAPATGTPVRGGLSFREGHYIMVKTGQLIGVDIAEVNPSIGNEEQREQTILIGSSLIRSALGEGLLY